MRVTEGRADLGLMTPRTLGVTVKARQEPVKELTAETSESQIHNAMTNILVMLHKLRCMTFRSTTSLEPSYPHRLTERASLSPSATSS